jgi:hypothetical protein
MKIVAVLRESCPSCFETIEFDLRENEMLLDERESRAYLVESRFVRFLDATCLNCLRTFKIEALASGVYVIHQSGVTQFEVDFEHLMAKTLRAVHAALHDSSDDREPLRAFAQELRKLEIARSEVKKKRSSSVLDELKALEDELCEGDVYRHAHAALERVRRLISELES